MLEHFVYYCLLIFVKVSQYLVNFYQCLNFIRHKNLPHKIIKKCQSVSIFCAFPVSPLLHSLVVCPQWSHELIPQLHSLLLLLYSILKFLNFSYGFYMQNPMFYLSFSGKGGYRHESHPEHFLVLDCLLFGSCLVLVRRYLRVFINFLALQGIGSPKVTIFHFYLILSACD